MKTLYIILTLIFTTSIVHAQSPVIDIEEKDFRNIVEGAYYKDINNYLNPFEGTWLYTNGNTSFKIVVSKIEMNNAGIIYSDVLKGEYQYIEDGVEKVNTLNNSEITTSGCSGSKLLKSNNYPYCEDCNNNERRVSLLIRDTERGLSARFVLKLTSVNGQEALEGQVYGGAPVVYNENNPPQYFSMNVPDGTYTFIKQ